MSFWEAYTSLFWPVVAITITFNVGWVVFIGILKGFFQ